MMFGHHLDATGSPPVRQNWDEAMHLSEKFELLRDLTPEGLERAPQIVDRESGHRGNEPIGNF